MKNVNQKAPYFLYLYFITTFFTLKPCDFSGDTKKSNNYICLSLFDNRGKKIRVASGTEEPKYIDLNTLLILDKNDRQNGHGSRLLEEFLSYADTCSKPVFATANPIGHKAGTSLSKAINGLMRFYQKHGTLVLSKNEEEANIVFQHHHSKRA